LEQDMAAHTTLEVTPRHLWLALLGGAGLARRQVVAGLCAARTQGGRIGETLRAGGDDARDIGWGLLLTAREKFAKKPRARATRRRIR
jgi:hypothetical protein